jgi:hypothetical protein
LAEALPQPEVDVACTYFRQWVEQAINLASSLNPDSFSGGVSYILLAMVYRADFLFVPVGNLMARIEKINTYYWSKKDDIAILTRNRMMLEEVRTMLGISREEFAHSMHRGKATFSIAPAAVPDKVKDHVTTASKDASWYADNGYDEIALGIVEFGMLYPHYAYSMPAVQTALTTLLMAVLHPEYFLALGIDAGLYDPANGTLNEPAIRQGIARAIAPWAWRYPQLQWDYDRISYASRNDFAGTYTLHVANLNLQTRHETS